MRNLYAFGLTVCFFLIFPGFSHASDSSVCKLNQGIITAQISGTPQEDATTQTVAAPAVEVPETAFDFGKVGPGNDYVHAFKVRNTGPGVLEIRKIIPG
jgi:hypothetical protein